MCNEYQLTLSVTEVVAAVEEGGEALDLPEGLPNLGDGASIRIGDRAPVIVNGAAGAELRSLPWAWKGPQGRPVFNFRSEGRDLSRTARCLVPADGFFEFTAAEPGQKRKTKWRFSLAGTSMFWMAGVIKDDAFALLTTAPGPDVAPYHDRQVATLDTSSGRHWLHLADPGAGIVALAAGRRLEVRKIFPVGSV